MYFYLFRIWGGDTPGSTLGFFLALSSCARNPAQACCIQGLAHCTSSSAQKWIFLKKKMELSPQPKTILSFIIIICCNGSGFEKLISCSAACSLFSLFTSLCNCVAVIRGNRSCESLTWSAGLPCTWLPGTSLLWLWGSQWQSCPNHTGHVRLCQGSNSQPQACKAENNSAMSYYPRCLSLHLKHVGISSSSKPLRRHQLDSWNTTSLDTINQDVHLMTSY